MEIEISSKLCDSGFEVVSLDHGVYWLRRYEGPNNELTFEGAGILWLPHSLTLLNPEQSALTNVYLLEYNAINFKNDPVAVDRLKRTWCQVNAGRLMESGVPSAIIGKVGDFGRIIRSIVEYPRDDGRVRIGVQMESGDVLCYN